MQIIVLGVHTHGHLFIVITNLFNSTPVMSNSCLNSANLIRRPLRFLLQQNENEFSNHVSKPIILPFFLPLP